MSTNGSELCYTGAKKLARLIRTRKLGAAELMRAFVARIERANLLRTRVFHTMRSFLERYEFLLLPVSQVPPFPVDLPYVSEINGIRLPTYLDWMKTCYYITATSHPAISVPAGFTGDGLPVGLQIVGRYRDDFGVLQLAHAFEQATQTGKRGRSWPPEGTCIPGRSRPAR